MPKIECIGPSCPVCAIIKPSILSKIFKKIKCYFNGHDPVLRKDMELVIPYREIKCSPFLIVRSGGRILHIGETVCSHCGCMLEVSGVIVKKLK